VAGTEASRAGGEAVFTRVDQPQVAAVQVNLQRGMRYDDCRDAVQQIVRRELERMPELYMELAQGKYSVF
jgi:S-adenosylmethionine synthetase